MIFVQKPQNYLSKLALVLEPFSLQTSSELSVIRVYMKKAKIQLNCKFFSHLFQFLQFCSFSKQTDKHHVLYYKRLVLFAYFNNKFKYIFFIGCI